MTRLKYDWLHQLVYEESILTYENKLTIANHIFVAYTNQQHLVASEKQILSSLPFDTS